MWVEGRATLKASDGAPGRAVAIALDIRGLSIRNGRGEEIDHWPFRGLVRLKAPQAVLAVGLSGDPARLEIDDPASLAAFRPALKAIPMAGQRTVPTSFIVATLAMIALIAAIVVLTLWLLASAAALFAPMVQDDLLAAIDRTTIPTVLSGLGTDAGQVCRSDDGAAALDRLADRLMDAGDARQMALDIAVYRSAVPNAVALPGGSIVVTSALIDRVAEPDGFAGVLAHEIAHVHYRHGLQAMLHQGGVSLVLAAITGDTTSVLGSAAGVLIGARYSRDAEREADAFAVDAVAAGGGDPRALGAFLSGLADLSGEAPISLLASHPMSAERKAAIDSRAADRAPRPGPLVPPSDWTAIRAMCG